MQDNGTAVLDRQEAGPVSPVITREDGWLGDDDRDQSLLLQLRLPISANELAAALYDDDGLCPADLAADQNVWGFAAVAIIQDGLNTIQRRPEEIAVAEMRGTLANPDLAGHLPAPRRRSNRNRPQPHSGPASMRALTEAASPCHAGAQP